MTQTQKRGVSWIGMGLCAFVGLFVITLGGLFGRIDAQGDYYFFWGTKLEDGPSTLSRYPLSPLGSVDNLMNPQTWSDYVVLLALIFIAMLVFVGLGFLLGGGEETDIGTAGIKKFREIRKAMEEASKASGRKQPTIVDDRIIEGRQPKTRKFKCRLNTKNKRSGIDSGKHKGDTPAL